MKLARAIHFDDSDTRVFHNPARTGEWCISGGFEFSNWSEGDLVGKARQAFSNGWFGLETFGRTSFVAVTSIQGSEIDALTDALASHFVTIYGAPDLDSARPVAAEEIRQMIDLCDDHDPNTLLTVARELTDAGVREGYRAIPPQDAGLEQFAIHVTED
ncbi:DUF6505 family protein [Loktanella sp. SALINAS62]|uniref:DUF6505 family protein n=1 Tax=Loktanella sp. SALINAS62 TaxID=2706124 RepID=UPI001B8B25DE|nr:DUF6505 family protein [Loktanella sp. SALINAS62]MBS1303721.1 hypothetical protein [Loktanella sp. SALINAS62]